jgi:hypothetical protein
VEVHQPDLDLQHTLLRLTDEIPGWAATGRCEFEDFEQYLLLQGVLKDFQSINYNSLNGAIYHMSESGTSFSKRVDSDEDDDED